MSLLLMLAFVPLLSFWVAVAVVVSVVEIVLPGKLRVIHMCTYSYKLQRLIKLLYSRNRLLSICLSQRKPTLLPTLLYKQPYHFCQYFLPP